VALNTHPHSFFKKNRISNQYAHPIRRNLGNFGAQCFGGSGCIACEAARVVRGAAYVVSRQGAVAGARIFWRARCFRHGRDAWPCACR
jgi:hypothetical protein